jgi:hypothetical protein
MSDDDEADSNEVIQYKGLTEADKEEESSKIIKELRKRRRSGKK